MTVEDVAAELERIRGMAGDPEAAHSAEDALWENVLFAIAEHKTEDAPNLALAALRSKYISFPRWFA